ncbi:IclR family transcriptional regulator [Sinomonas sp. B1-1]|uniref:IclR family transcriptional regulator n=1 Tax=Sinomonas sp. B1-1 TaxID=3141454 RepID=UPI003D28F001
MAEEPVNAKSPAGASPVESVDRALRLALALRAGEPLTVAGAAQLLDVAPSTAHRLLNALVHRGFAVQERDRSYTAGPVFVGRPAEVPHETLRHLALPVLQELGARIHETVQVMVLSGNSVRFLDGVEATDRNLRIGARRNDLMPAYCSAGGKAILAEIANPELEALYRGGLTPWPTARFTTLTALKRNLATVRRVGYGTSIEETEQGVRGLGVAVNGPDGKTVAALTAAVPSVRFRREETAPIVAALHDAAEALAESLRRAAAEG